MLALILYALVLAKTWLLSYFGGPHRALMVALLPLIVLDCLGNLLHGGSWRNTLSGEAWNQREHKHWGWCHRFIDTLFFLQADHCKVQAEREAKHGSVWAAWAADWRGAL